jgi:hypothetical protein
MKLVNLTAVDIDQFKNALPKIKPAAPDLHHEELTVDDVTIELVRPTESKDVRTNTYSLGFSHRGSDYMFIVRPTMHEVPSVTLNIIRKATDQSGDVEFTSYTVLKDTVTTLKGQLSGMAKSQTEGTTSKAALANFDLASALDHLKVR